MRRGIVIAGAALVLAGAGLSAAYLQSRENASPGPEPSAALAPVTPAEAAAATAGVSSPGCACCSGPASPSAAGSGRTARIEAYLTDFYTNILGQGVSVQVQDLGCHHEASVLKDGEVVKRLSISGNSITDIT